MRFHRSLAPGAGLRPSSVLSMQQTLNINSASPSPPTFSEDNSISVWKLLFCRNVDTNANGAIDFNEFIDMMVKRRDCLEDDVAHAFKADLWAMFDESLRLEATATTLIIYMKEGHGSAKATKIESSYLNEIPLQMSPKGMWGPENMKNKNFRWGLFEFYIFLY